MKPACLVNELVDMQAEGAVEDCMLQLLGICRIRQLQVAAIDQHQHPRREGVEPQQSKVGGASHRPNLCECLRLMP